MGSDPFGWMSQPWHLATEDEAPALDVTAIKELIAKLDEKQRQEIYLWLYNLGHRKW